ncbi:MAG: methionyl-tRNA formyltransferase [Candidatus Magasanikbacteria bacterium]|nr:methionyl-tRNA formyltransferase [Candidatus Magasanikbacteria bacterium]
MIITFLVDNNSWILPYVDTLIEELKADGEHTIHFVRRTNDIREGDCAFFLGCIQLVKESVLKRNKHNLVIHESALPQGKGWSPLTWQILGGKSIIPITLFEAEVGVDSGDIYLQSEMKFEGHELNDELKDMQGKETVKLVKQFIDQYESITATSQQGEETFYDRRRPKDSELDIEKSIKEQFNLLRVVDNEKYPAFFDHKGYRYIVKIEKSNEK